MRVVERASAGGVQSTFGEADMGSHDARGEGPRYPRRTMRGPGPAAASAVTVLLLAAASSLPPAPVRAVEEIPSVTSAHGVVRPALSAMVGDVDGDGIRELVQIGQRELNPTHLAVEVTAIGPSGEPESHGQALLRRGVAPETQESAGPLPDGGFIPVGSNEPARLLAWNEAGVERVLAVAVGVEREPRACCLTIHQVALDRGETALRLLADAQLAADGIGVLDMDGDGTDELFIVEPPSADAPGLTVFSILRWQDGRFVRVATDAVAGTARSALHALGDSDGLAGAEVGFTTHVELDGPHDILHRIALVDGDGLRIDEYELSVRAEPVPIDGPDGPLIALVALNAGVQLVSWPAGDDLPTVTADSERRGIPLGSLGTRRGARLYLLGGGGTVNILDAELAPKPPIAASPPAAAFLRDPGTPPYVGPLPGGLPDGRDALIFRGQLIADPGSAQGSPFTAAVTPIASLPGRTPIGVLGPNGAWIAMARADRFDAGRRGGLLAPERLPGAVLQIVATEAVLAPELDAGRLEPALVGAVPDAREPVRSVLVAAGPFTMQVAAPVGSEARLAADTAAVAAHTVEVEEEGGVAVLPIQSAVSGADLPPRFGLRVEVVTPTGHGYMATFLTRIETDAPEVDVSAPFAPLAGDVTISGQTEPGVSVLVDGLEVPVDEQGGFTVRVPAGLLPREVPVVAADQVGNTATTSVSVVMPIDYRRLPWIPIVGVLTGLLTAFLYVRAPRLARPPSRAAGEGTFEEIE